MKKILLCTFMLCCCISSMFAQMWTDENGVKWYFSVNGNEATITGANNFGTEVIVPEKVFYTYQPAEGDAVTEEYTVTAFGNDFNDSPVFMEGKANISKVTLPSTIKTIIKNAFSGCSSLKSVDGLSSCSSIGRSAFDGCSSLQSVGDLSSCTSIGNYAFYYCSSLQSVGDLSACTSIGSSAFNGCSSLASVGDLSSCTSIGNHAFYGCSYLQSVGDLPVCTS
ncbi:MAG: leucine-rich repeat domain-containing protein, partial [Bacteroidaceae bacterium]|nr:leucine-rich repeat domain-containing protein [Bacteroidaceae bacterium]